MLSAVMLSLAAVVAILIAALSAFQLRHRSPADGEAFVMGDEKESYTDNESAASQTAHDRTPLPAELPPSVTRSDQHLIGRDAWVLRMTHHVFEERHHSRYNVLVVNNDLEYHFSAEGVVEEFVVKYNESKHRLPTVTTKVVPYRIIVFNEGSMVNMGDGGDVNWDWQGNFVRSGTKVVSFKPCVPGFQYQQDPWLAVKEA